MVVGAKGSPLQLVLSAVLHIDAPTGNIKLQEAETLMQHPFVDTAIPVSYGDNYKGYRILGTELAYLDHYGAKVANGRPYQKPFEVVVGSNAAIRLGLKVGDEFVSSHGLAASASESHDDHPFQVTGILLPTGTVIDQLLISDLESIWLVHDHGEEDHDAETAVDEGAEDDHHHDSAEHDHDEGDHHHDESAEHDHDGEDHHHDDSAEHDHDEEEDHGHHHDEEKEITALLLKFNSPLGMVQLPRFINENTSMQAALPGYEVQRLLGLLGSGVQTINGIAFAILLVSGLSIFISLLKTIRERKQELALLRTYGLRTEQLLGLALLEGLFLALIGFILGWILGRIGIWGASIFTQESYGYSLEITGPDSTEFLLFALVLVLAAVAALLASASIFKLNVAKTLSDA